MDARLKEMILNRIEFDYFRKKAIEEDGVLFFSPVLGWGNCTSAVKVPKDATVFKLFLKELKLMDAFQSIAESMEDF